MSDIIGIIASGKSIATRAGIKGEGEKVSKKLIGVNFDRLVEKGIIELAEIDEETKKKIELEKLEAERIEKEELEKAKLNNPEIKDEIKTENIEAVKVEEIKDEEIKDEIKIIKKPIVVGAVKK